MLDKNVMRMLSVNRSTRMLAAQPFGGSGEYQPPVVTAVSEQYGLHEMLKHSNIYQISDGIYRKDGDVSGIINRYGHMCKTAYGGVYIEAGKELDTNELDLLEAAQDVANNLNFPSKFMAIAVDMIRDGDVIRHMVWDSKNGITKLQALPRPYLTAVNEVQQVTQLYKWITDPKYYVVFEGTQDQIIFKKEVCSNFAMNNESQFITDVMARTTFGVWSVPPLEPLLSTIEWKVNAIINDILWTHRNVPREHHQLDLSMYTPDGYNGTPAERMSQAEAAGQAVADGYSASISNQNTDVAYITDSKTIIGFVEPKSTNYQSPNEKLRQINEGIANALGMAPVMRDQSYASALMSGSFAIMASESIANIIALELEDVMRRSIRIKYGPRFKESDLKKVKIRTRLILAKDKTEIMRQIAIMVDSGVFTPSEIRAEWGKEPLTLDQIAEIARMSALVEREKKNFLTIKGMVEDTVNTTYDPATVYPTYPSEVGRRDELA